MEKQPSNTSVGKSANDFMASIGWEDLTVDPNTHEVPNASDIPSNGKSVFTLVESGDGNSYLEENPLTSSPYGESGAENPMESGESGAENPTESGENQPEPGAN